MTSEEAIERTCDELKRFLLAKNRAYGDSAFRPVGAFAKGLDAEQQIRVRIDDKISRAMRGHEYPGDDTVVDLAGYLVLLLAVRAIDEAERAGLAKTAAIPF